MLVACASSSLSCASKSLEARSDPSHIAAMRDAAEINKALGSTWRAADPGPQLSVDFELRLDLAGKSLSFVGLTRCSGSTLDERPIWQHRFIRARDASGIFEWMVGRRDDWPFWGRLTGLIGPDRLFAAAAADVARARTERAADLLGKRKEAKAVRQREQEISSYLVEKDGRFGVDLTRGDERKGFFVIWFRENWERERFRDWWRPQHHRFAEFAVLHNAQGALALERMLLREMQDTEKRIKAAGLGAGGRRPLRFYRGEE